MAKDKQLTLEAKILNDAALAGLALELEECEEGLRTEPLRRALTEFNKLRKTRGELKTKILDRVDELEGPSEESRQFIVDEVHEFTIKANIREATSTPRKVLYQLNLKLLGDGDDDGS